MNAPQRKAAALLAACAGLAPVAACSGPQSALAPHGQGAMEIGALFWLFTVVCAVIWVLVMIVLLGALLRSQSSAGQAADPLAVDRERDSRAMHVVVAAVVVTGFVLIGFAASSYVTGKSIADLGSAEGLTIRVTGHQWWWEVRYEAEQPNRTLTTANEIVIPAGVPIHLKLASTDVIHSFWVPNLTGKRDLIPGHENELRLIAHDPGTYRGQCAEFCGLQHAHMAILVKVLPRDEFDAWMERQLRPAEQPAGPQARAGQQVLPSGARVALATDALSALVADLERLQ